MNRRKFEDLLITSELFFNRADRFPQDDQEGLAPSAYARLHGLNPLDILDNEQLRHHEGTDAQFRESFFINCWHLYREETAAMWKNFGQDGVAIVSTYAKLKTALDVLPESDDPHLGLVRYGTTHLTGRNLMVQITTKREDFAGEREVRALLWIRDEYAGINRHFDVNNRAHNRPLTPPPGRVKNSHRRHVDLHSLLSGVVVTPWAETDTLRDFERLVSSSGHGFPVVPSELTRFRQFLP
jgi:hypothetical protein